jgi:hypothetical protein
MNFISLEIPNIYNGMIYSTNASILVRKHNTNELSYYIENDDDTLELVYRERSSCDGIISGTIVKPYTWEYENPYIILGSKDRNYEDPRIWLFNKKPYISFSQYPNILFSEYNNEIKKMELCIHLTMNNNNEVEKNWGFFEHEGVLCMVYYPNPLIIYEFDYEFNIINKSQELCDVLDTCIHGGSPPVYHPIEKIYYMFVHKSIVEYNYNIWCIAFTKIDNKWKIKGYTEERLNKGNPRLISFVAGAVYDKQKESWILSGGYRDEEIGIWTIEHIYLKSKMIWL